MADSNVGRTIGIVVAVTAAVGLGLYLILKPKTATAATSTTNTAANISSAQIAALQAQLDKMQQEAIANQNSISAQQKAANQAQLNSILLALGGKLANTAVDKMISSWNNPHLDTTPIYYDQTTDGINAFDVSTPTTLDPTLPAWAQDYVNGN
jgi:hypothetical protein